MKNDVRTFHIFLGGTCHNGPAQRFGSPWEDLGSTLGNYHLSAG